MLPENTQTIAALIAVVSMTLFGVELLVLREVWKKLDYYFLSLPEEKKRRVKWRVFWQIIPPSVALGAYTITGIYDPENAPAIFLMVALIIIAIMTFAVLIGRVTSWLKGKKESKITEKVDMSSILFVGSFVFLLIGMLISLMALVVVSATMLDITVGIWDIESYVLGRWVMLDAIIFFVLGIFMVGVAYLYENRKRV